TMPMVEVEGKKLPDIGHIDPKKDISPPFKKCEPKHGEEEHEEHGGEACWKTSYQPAVCRPGYFWAERCTPGPGMKKAIAALQADADRLGKSKDEKDIAAVKKLLEQLQFLMTCMKGEE